MGAANDLQESRRVAASPLWMGRGIGREHSTHSTEEERNLLMMAAKEGRKEGRQLLPFNSLGKVDRPFEGKRVRETEDHRREGRGSGT